MYNVRLYTKCCFLCISLWLVRNFLYLRRPRYAKAVSQRPICPAEATAARQKHKTTTSQRPNYHSLEANPPRRGYCRRQKHRNPTSQRPKYHSSEAKPPSEAKTTVGILMADQELSFSCSNSTVWLRPPAPLFWHGCQFFCCSWRIPVPPWMLPLNLCYKPSPTNHAFFFFSCLDWKVYGPRTKTDDFPRLFKLPTTQASPTLCVNRLL